MAPVRNPYNPGAGSRPPFLVGRDGELEAFDIAVQRLSIGRPAKSQMLTGLRGVGKTVLLREFGQIARGHGWVTEHIEATDDLDFVHAISVQVFGCPAVSACLSPFKPYFDDITDVADMVPV